jgi:hypothetical protein
MLHSELTERQEVLIRATIENIRAYPQCFQMDLYVYCPHTPIEVSNALQVLHWFPSINKLPEIGATMCFAGWLAYTHMQEERKQKYVSVPSLSFDYFQMYVFDVLGYTYDVFGYSPKVPESPLFRVFQSIFYDIKGIRDVNDLLKSVQEKNIWVPN